MGLIWNFPAGDSPGRCVVQCAFFYQCLHTAACEPLLQSFCGPLPAPPLTSPPLLQWQPSILAGWPLWRCHEECPFRGCNPALVAAWLTGGSCWRFGQQPSRPDCFPYMAVFFIGGGSKKLCLSICPMIVIQDHNPRSQISRGQDTMII